MLGIGHLGLGPGTWASAATVMLWWLFATRLHLTEAQLVAAAIAVTVGATFIGIPAATREAKRCGVSDPSHVVIDEVAGQMLSLIAAPLTWKTQLAGFILFRCFDILKPPPVRALERLPGGTGIVVDDLGAGVYAWVVLRLLLLAPWLR